MSWQKTCPAGHNSASKISREARLLTDSLQHKARWPVQPTKLKKVSRYDGSDCGGMLRKSGKIGAGGEGFFAYELAAQDADLAAQFCVAGVEDLHSCSAVDQ
jgi:hypothetical protein